MPQAKILIASTDDADMRYAIGCSMPDPCIWVQLGTEDRTREYLIVSVLEYERAKKEAKPGVRVILREKIDQKNIRKPIGRKKSLADLAAAFLLSYNISDIGVSERMWTAHYQALQEQGLRPRIEAPFFPKRLVKTQKEIKAIKRVGMVTKKAFSHVVGILRKSTIDWNDTLIHNGKPLTSEMLRSEINQTLISNGCSCEGTIVSCGPDSAQPHNRGAGLIFAGQPIVVDIFPQDTNTGYHFDVTRTFLKGTPSKEIKAMYNAVKKAQTEAISVVAPGKAALVHQTAQEVFDRAGYKTHGTEGFIHSLGHGLGLEIHESPSLSPSSEDILEAGNVITIEPGLYYKEIGGIRIEDTVLVTKTGVINLTNLPKGWIIK